MTNEANELDSFKSGLAKILKADPKLVKAAMEQEKQERAEKRKAGGKGHDGKTSKVGRV